MGKSKDMHMEHNNRFPCSDEQIEIINHQNQIEMTEKLHPDALKQRVINAKKELPHGIVPLFVHVFPDWDTYKKRSKITNVLQLRMADAEITEMLEQLVERLKNESND